MSFTADKQTLDDLGLLGKFKQHSIFSIFNKVRTGGGERLLEQLFREPLTDPDRINARSDAFRYFQEKKLHFPFRQESFQVVEHYLETGAAGNLAVAMTGMLRRKITGVLLKDEQYGRLQAGLAAAIEMLRALKQLTATIDLAWVKPARDILADKRLDWLETARPATFSLAAMAKYDHLLRHVLQGEMEILLGIVYQLDVHIAVSNVSREKGFSYARALPVDAHTFRTTALRHPGLGKAVANPLSLNSRENVLFLTGANMAGKSTLMKAFGIAVYMAHMGFPVAAEDLQFSVQDGLYSSINVPDNLNMGYSHFYAEVLRVKQVAEAVSAGKNMIVIFDELFKGTNVKDAYDATLAVTAAFAKYVHCFFIVSTHIIEVGEALKTQRANIRFAFLPTVMEGHTPRYTYALQEGITSDRQGMIIIENEGIIDMMKMAY